ncbi:MAG: hypothetical protein BWY20_02171 [Spirochaetes bacterium ADurb.Bin215]|nr:MAG: hypothetical protein BWY20_02171 [Spirochaetes bacterium ADurb.Bin215]
MYPDRVDIFNKTDGNHLVLAVANHFHFKFFPAEDGFLDETLVGHGKFKPAIYNCPQFFHIVHKPAAGAAHGIGRPDNDRVSELFSDFFRGFHGIGDIRAGCFNPQALHGFLEYVPVLAAFDRVEINTDYFHPVFVKDSGLVQLAREVEAGLSAEIRQQRVRTFLIDYLLEPIQVERFNVGRVRHNRIGHDRRGIGIDKNDLVALFAKRLARLSTGIIEFACLSDNNRSRPDNQHFPDIIPFHKSPLI